MTLSTACKTQITFAVEPWINLWRDAQELFQKHWEELALDQDKIALGVDFNSYVLLDIQGKLHIVTARNDGQLVGYFIAFLMIHPHYKDAGVMALADVYYVLPEFRGVTGVQLLTEVERTLKERGVKKAYLSCKIHQDHSRLFNALGWKPTDITFSKYLG